MQDDAAERKRLVRESYDLIAGSYLASKDTEDPLVLKQLEAFASGLPPDAVVLDLGCGAGLPATAYLSQQHYVIGVDFSPAQITLAEQLVPSATFLCQDMTELDFPSESFDAVLALWSIIHVPREDQPRLLSDIFDWLRPGGRFLATWPLNDWEGADADWNHWGAPMWWSHYGAEQCAKMMKAAGFLIQNERKMMTGGETWIWVLATRPL